ncbi:hypothetical protein [Stackebrandtia albiflava]|uniref:hypothetical protein n=1 Tax=Stackebrandtia albiflava TaxID=406432 RepID=UPI0011BED1B5|nr:hypothetical protein [Stackebrandtia albiflava]
MRSPLSRTVLVGLVTATAFLLTGCGGTDQGTPEATTDAWLAAMAEGDHEAACLLVVEDDTTPASPGTAFFAECTAAFMALTAGRDSADFESMVDMEPVVDHHDEDSARLEFNDGEDVVQLRLIGDRWYISAVS